MLHISGMGYWECRQILNTYNCEHPGVVYNDDMPSYPIHCLNTYEDDVGKV